MQSKGLDIKKSWEKLEDDVYYKWFPKAYFICMHRTPPFQDFSKGFNWLALKPDFRFVIKGTTRKFWIECKSRKVRDHKNYFRLFKPDQRARYNKEENVLIFLRLSHVKTVRYYLIPLYKFKSDIIVLKQLASLRIWDHTYIKPTLIKKYINLYSSFYVFLR